jgi:hypothetical protein
MLALVIHFAIWFGVPVPLKGGGTTAGFDASCANVNSAVETSVTRNKVTRVFMEILLLNGIVG